MIEDLMNLRNSGAEIQTTEIDKIYAMPLNTNTSKVLKFINAAASDDESCEFLQGVLFQDNFAVATDGRRMHIYLGDAFNISKYGTAKVSLSKKEALCVFYECRFPRFKRVIPEITDTTMTVNLVYHKIHGICEFIYPLSKHTFVFNDSYLKDLVSYANTWRAYFSENTNAVVFESLDNAVPKIFAVIAPIKVL